MAYWMILDKESFPSWILPVKPLEKIGDEPYEDDDED
jgi:hypothetical protein